MRAALIGKGGADVAACLAHRGSNQPRGRLPAAAVTTTATSSRTVRAKITAVYTRLKGPAIDGGADAQLKRAARHEETDASERPAARVGRQGRTARLCSAAPSCLSTRAQGCFALEHAVCGGRGSTAGLVKLEGHCTFSQITRGCRDAPTSHKPPGRAVCRVALARTFAPGSRS